MSDNVATLSILLDTGGADGHQRSLRQSTHPGRLRRSFVDVDHRERV